ncbi:Insect cuticle protein,Chitin-binding type R&R consensus [Cinara cedri]|uniref:Insect cuticle protein,Chitin-binding type R&R consensus n=1 Tax=Cinara cedri TaxID=506608 RepID=A0A5E4MYX9_9HEMI|nr:Insect cuticle protein,Chitin-binding type R&R consensus [Cinara cedri]
MSQQKVAIVLILSVFLTSFASAQYGSPVGNSNPGYGGTGTSVPSGDYGHKGQNPVAPPTAGGSDGNSEPEPFNFAYQVKDAPTNTDFKHEANSDGKTVTGEYSVLLPDGRNQVVTYTADENGFNAKVNYEGEAKPQPNNPAGPGSYAPASSSYPSSAPGFPSAAAPGGYPSSAPGYPSSAPGFPSAAAPSYPAAAAPSYPAAAPGYPSAGGVKGSYAAPQPKNGGY